MEIKHCALAPADYFCEVDQDFLFVESAWWSYRDYQASCQAVCKPQMKVIIDNSTHLFGKPLPFKRSIDIAKHLQEFEGSLKIQLILPDVKGNSDVTALYAERALGQNQKYLEGLNAEYIGVIQGGDFGEWLDCLEFYEEIGVVHIALPYMFEQFGDNRGTDEYKSIEFDIAASWRILLKKCDSMPLYGSPINRVSFALWLKRYSNFKPSIHLLGLRDPAELVMHVREATGVESVDSSMAYRYADIGVEFSLNLEKFYQTMKRVQASITGNMGITDELGPNKLYKYWYNAEIIKMYANGEML